jgi:hypothetical protein
VKSSFRKQRGRGCGIHLLRIVCAQLQRKAHDRLAQRLQIFDEVADTFSDVLVASHNAFVRGELPKDEIEDVIVTDGRSEGRILENAAEQRKLEHERRGSVLGALHFVPLLDNCVTHLIGIERTVAQQTPVPRTQMQSNSVHRYQHLPLKSICFPQPPECHIAVELREAQAAGACQRVLSALSDRPIEQFVVILRTL